MKHLFFFCWLAGLLSVPLFAQNKTLTPPPGSKQVNQQTVTLGGQTAEAVFYESSAIPADVAAYYRQRFAEQKFDVSDDTNKDNNTFLKFQKDNETFSVIAEPDGQGSKFTVAHSIKTGDMQDVKWDEIIKLIPKADVPGSDLDIVSRPPDSVRIVDKISGRWVVLCYISKRSIDYLRNFYQESMPDYGWQETQAGTLNGQLAAAQGKAKNISDALDGMKLLPNMPLMRMAGESVIMHFAGLKGEAIISLMAMNPDDPSAGNAVTIRYVEKSEIYEKAKAK